MKKITIILLTVLFSILGMKAQCNLPYKPLSEFKKDTTAFIIYNFMDRKDCYKGKTLKEVTNDLGLPIKYYTRGSIERGALFGYVYIYIYDANTVRKMWDSKKEDNSIMIFWETPINVLSQEYKRLTRIKWDDGAYDCLKSMKIKELKVGISEYSKYYEKYKEKETKSSDPNKRREGDW